MTDKSVAEILRPVARQIAVVYAKHVQTRELRPIGKTASCGNGEERLPF
jgi:hypothetical protein